MSGKGSSVYARRSAKIVGSSKRFRTISIAGRAERGDRRVATVTAGYDPGLAPMSEVQLLRIIQEALSNVRKHAKARRAWVSCNRPARVSRS